MTMRKRYNWLSFLSLLFFFFLHTSADAQTQWQGEFGLGLSDQGYAMVEGPDGDIYVGGEFDQAGPYATSGLARWDGEHWHPVADFDGDLRALHIHGDMLYAGGNFDSVTPHGDAEITTSNIVRKNLDTGSWSEMDGGLQGGSVETFADDADNSLYAGGCFRENDGRSLDRIARWDGNNWRPLKAGTDDRNGVSACVYDMQYDEDNGRLYLGGNFRAAVNYDAIEDENQTIVIGGVAYYDGRWRQIGGGISDEYPGLPNPRVSSIHLHDNGNLYVGGTLWKAYNDADREVEVEIRTFARWDGSEWQSIFDQNYGTMHVIVASGDILHLGGYFENAGTDGQETFKVNSYAQYNTQTGELLTNEVDESPFGEGFTDADGTIRRQGLIRDILIPENGDDVFVTGRFDRAHIDDGLTDQREIDRIARWDGDTWHALGTGFSDEVTSLDAVGDTLFIAGGFHHIANRGEMFASPHLAVFDRSTGLFVPSETAATPYDGGRGYEVTTDPVTGTAYAALSTRTITLPDGETESGNILKWNPVAERWDPLGRVRQSQQQDHWIRDMEFAGGQLYVAGRFATLFGQDTPAGRADLVRYNPDTDALDWPDTRGLIAPDHRRADALAHDEECLYALFWVNSNFREHTTGNIMCLDFETDEPHWYPGYLSSSQGGSVDLLKSNEFLYIAHSASGWVRFFDDDGEVTSEKDLSNNISLLHPQTESWLSWPGEYGAWVSSLAKHENALYVAGRNTEIDDIEFDGISLYDKGSAQWVAVGDALQQSFTSRNDRSGVAVIDDEIWTWGDFRFTGSSGSAFLARYPEVSEGTPGPAAAYHTPDLTLALQQDQSVEIPVYIPNIGNENLDWSLTVDQSGESIHGKAGITGTSESSSMSGSVTDEPWITTDATSGTAPAGSVDSVVVTLDPSSLQTGEYEGVIEITGSDAVSETNEIPVSLTVNPLQPATGPYPEDDQNNVPAIPSLTWENQRFPDEVTVYLGTSEMLDEDDILYQGAPVDSLPADSVAALLDAPLEAFGTYYWRVDQSNAVSEAEGEVWSFRTAAGENKIAIGDQEYGIDYYPVYPSNNPAWIQTLFPGNEIGRSGTITSLAYYYLGEADATLDVSIYMGTTADESFEDNESWVPEPELTLVYEGELEMEETGEAYWLDLELEQPFEYDAGENLVIGVFSDDDRDLGDAMPGIRFYSTDRDEPLSLFWYGEEEVDPENAAGNGYNWRELPDIRLTFGEADDDPGVVEPGIASLTNPENGAENLTAGDVVLEWEHPAEADSVELQVAEHSEFEGDLAVSAVLEGGSESGTYEPDDLQDEMTYYWRIRVWEEDTVGEWSDTWSFSTGIPTAADATADVPDKVELRQNYPNPFNPDTRIRYGVPESGQVRLTVYNALGQHVATLVNENQSEGWHEVRFDAGSLSSGVYIYEITAGDVVETRAMMLVK